MCPPVASRRVPQPCSSPSARPTASLVIDRRHGVRMRPALPVEQKHVTTRRRDWPGLRPWPNGHSGGGAEPMAIDSTSSRLARTPLMRGLEGACVHLGAGRHRSTRAWRGAVAGAGRFGGLLWCRRGVAARSSGVIGGILMGAQVVSTGPVWRRARSGDLDQRRLRGRCGRSGPRIRCTASVTWCSSGGQGKLGLLMRSVMRPWSVAQSRVARWRGSP